MSKFYSQTRIKGYLAQDSRHMGHMGSQTIFVKAKYGPWRLIAGAQKIGNKKNAYWNAKLVRNSERVHS